jgi:hypothetical protein
MKLGCVAAVPKSTNSLLRPSAFTKELLHPRRHRTARRLARWRESKSSTPWVDLEGELLRELQMRLVSCFPRNELHYLSAVTFEGREPLSRRVIRSEHFSRIPFWKLGDPHIPCHSTTSAVTLLPHDATQTGQSHCPRKGTGRMFPSIKSVRDDLKKGDANYNMLRMTASSHPVGELTPRISTVVYAYAFPSASPNKVLC